MTIVAGIKTVSVGGSLYRTTLIIDDLPLLRAHDTIRLIAKKYGRLENMNLFKPMNKRRCL